MGGRSFIIGDTVSSRRLLLLGALLGAWAPCLSAQKPVQPKPAPPGAWVLIGRTQASHSADHDALVVHGPNDNFTRIKFKVTDAPLNLYRMAVTYDNGTAERIEIRQNIPKGGESRVIDLKGGKRSIRTIEFWYDSKGLLNGKADVTVFGRK